MVMQIAHTGQTRDEGLPYSTHPLTVFWLLQEYGVVSDVNTCCAALLHDTLEMGFTEKDLRHYQIPPEAIKIVKEVSKDKKGKFRIKSKAAMAVKMADRLHNLSTLPLCDKKKQVRYIRDTEKLLAKNKDLMIDSGIFLYYALLAMFKYRKRRNGIW